MVGGTVVSPTYAICEQYSVGATSDIGNLTSGNCSQWNRFTRGFGVADYGDVTQPATIVQRVTAIFFGLLGIIAVVMVMYAGFLWLTAGGEEEKTKQATTLLFQAIIGLIIILASWMLTYFVLEQLTRAIIGGGAGSSPPGMRQDVPPPPETDRGA